MAFALRAGGRCKWLVGCLQPHSQAVRRTDLARNFTSGVFASISKCARWIYCVGLWIPMRFLRDHVSSVPAAASQANVRESSNVAWLKTGRRTDSLPPRKPFMKTGVGFQFTTSSILDRAGAQLEQPRSCLEQHCSFYATATSELPVQVQKVAWAPKVTT